MLPMGSLKKNVSQVGQPVGQLTANIFLQMAYITIKDYIANINTLMYFLMF